MRFPSSSKTMEHAYQLMEMADNINEMPEKIKPEITKEEKKTKDME